jgi:hypothetical protein
MMIIMNKNFRLKVIPSKLYPDVDFKTCLHTCVSNLRFTHPRKVLFRQGVWKSYLKFNLLRLEALYTRARFEFSSKESSNLLGANLEYGSRQVSLKQRPQIKRNLKESCL